MTVIDYWERRQRGRALYAETGQGSSPLTSGRRVDRLRVCESGRATRSVAAAPADHARKPRCRRSRDTRRPCVRRAATGDLSYDEIQEVIPHRGTADGRRPRRSSASSTSSGGAARRTGNQRAGDDEPSPSVPSDQELRKQGGEQEFADVNRSGTAAKCRTTPASSTTSSATLKRPGPAAGIAGGHDPPVSVSTTREELIQSHVLGAALATSRSTRCGAGPPLRRIRWLKASFLQRPSTRSTLGLSKNAEVDVANTVIIESGRWVADRGPPVGCRHGAVFAAGRTS